MELVPTGIASLDSIIGGGFPAGSLVLLRSEIGAGSKEFLMSSTIMIEAIRRNLVKPVEAGVKIPQTCWWVTFTQAPDDILSEVRMSFERDLAELFRAGARFQDFLEDYFVTSPVPADWISEELEESKRRAALEGLTSAFASLRRAAGAPAVKPRTMLDALAEFLTANAKDNVVVLYTATDLARLYSDSESRWYDFTLFLRGFQRVAKRWGGLVYLPLTARILTERQEEEVSACVDGVINFRWEAAGPTRRRRVMYFQKFRGLLPRLEDAAAAKFEVNVTPTSGFEVARAELIEGLK
jgi:KaiC/GvpD/RAD55 family RecA-like ATPase